MQTACGKGSLINENRTTHSPGDHQAIKLNELHLFAGAGGGILGGMLLGHTCVCAVEIEPYCQKVLLQRQRDGILPRFPIWDDVRTFDGKPWRGKVDVVCGGFPCQDISGANKSGNGIYGERSGLWSEMFRVICEVEPRFIVLENSPRLTIRGLGKVLGDLASVGIDSRWGVLGACHARMLHKRERIWIIANAFKIPFSEKVKRGREKRFGQRRAIRGQPSSTGWWKSLPTIPRMVDGLADGMDRNAAIGNGQVPAVVKLAWETLIA